MELSVVCPVYKAEGVLNELVNKIEEAVKGVFYEYELIFIEDGSPDSSWGELMEMAKKNKRIKLLRLSRNFGQHNAISAGVELTSGNVVVVMDCDLQHDPKYIENMYHEIKRGNDIVMTRLNKRKHSFLKNFFTKIYYMFLSYLTEHTIKGDVSNYSMLSRKAVDAYLSYKDYYRTHLWILRWIGFSKVYLNIEHQKRLEGKTSYSFRRMFEMAVNISVTNSNKLLFLVLRLGVFLLVLSFVLLLCNILGVLNSDFFAKSILLFIIGCFFTGVVLSSLGIIALYLAKVFDQTKNRPRYIVDKSVNVGD